MLRIRPSFNRVVPKSPDRVLRHVKRVLIQRDVLFTGAFYNRHALLDLPEEERHVWSPQLSLDVERHPEGARVRGLFAPRPSVWTFYVTAYAALGFGGLIGLVFGTSQLSLGMEASALWSVPFALVLAGLVYGTAWIGQRLSRDQLDALEGFIHTTLDDLCTDESATTAPG